MTYTKLQFILLALVTSKWPVCSEDCNSSYMERTLLKLALETEHNHHMPRRPAACYEFDMPEFYIGTIGPGHN